MSLNVGTVQSFAKLNMKGFTSGMKTMYQEGNKTANRLERRFDQIGNKLTSIGRKATVGLTLPLVAGMTAGVREAGRLEGALAKFEVVFDGLNDEMHEFVDSFRSEFPIARSEIVKSASALQDLLVPMGVTRKEASGMTKEWMHLAGALSAFNDVPIDEALQAIESGLAGQSQPLRRFGIDVSETALKQRALAMGIMEAGDAMTAQIRAQALLAQATANSKDAIEGLEEQKGSFLWIVQELQADVKDLAAEFGSDLLPIVKDLIQDVRGVVGRFLDLDEATRKNIIRAAALAAALGPVSGGLGFALKNVIPLLRGTTKAVGLLTAATNAHPFIAVGTAIVALGGYLHSVSKNAREARDEMVKLSQSVEMGGNEDSINAEITALQNKISINAQVIAQLNTYQNKTEDVKKRIEELTNQNQKYADQLTDANTRLRSLGDQSEQTTDQQVTGFNNVAEAIDRVRVAASEPIDDIIDVFPLEKAKTELELIQEFLDLDYIEDLPDKMFPKGSLGQLNQDMAELRERMLYAFDPEVQQAIREEMEMTQAKINEIAGATENASIAGAKFGQITGNALSQAVLHGKEFMDIVENLAKQFASRAFIVGLQALAGGGLPAGASFLGEVFGGIFHTGGIVPGVGEKQINVRGGEAVLTSQQLSALTAPQQSSRSVSMNMRIPVMIGDREIYEANERYKVDVA